MSQKEAQARIKINRMLEASGWRFFDDENGQAKIQLEPHIKITQKDVNAFGEDFESTKSGFVDFLLVDEKGYPFIMQEAKSGEKRPLVTRLRSLWRPTTNSSPASRKKFQRSHCPYLGGRFGGEIGRFYI